VAIFNWEFEGILFPVEEQFGHVARHSRQRVNFASTDVKADMRLHNYIMKDETSSFVFRCFRFGSLLSFIFYFDPRNSAVADISELEQKLERNPMIQSESELRESGYARNAVSHSARGGLDFHTLSSALRGGAHQGFNRIVCIPIGPALSIPVYRADGASFAELVENRRALTS